MFTRAYSGDFRISDLDWETLDTEGLKAGLLLLLIDILWGVDAEEAKSLLRNWGVDACEAMNPLFGVC